MNILILESKMILAKGLESIIESTIESECTVKPLKEMYSVLQNEWQFVFIDLELLNTTERSLFFSLLPKYNQTTIVNWSDDPKWATIEQCLKYQIHHFCSQDTNKEEISRLFGAIANKESYYGKHELNQLITRKMSQYLLKKKDNISLTSGDKKFIISLKETSGDLKLVSQQLEIKYQVAKNRICKLKKILRVENNQELIDTVDELQLIH